MGLIAFIIIGLIAGLIARALMPGKQSMGLIPTTLLGMAGSLVGGLVGSLFRGGTASGHWFDLRPSGLLWSILGALAVLLLMGFANRARRRINV